MSFAIPEWLVEAFQYGGPATVAIVIALVIIRHYKLTEMKAQRAAGHSLLGIGVMAFGVLLFGLVCEVFHLPYATVAPGQGFGGGALGLVGIGGGLGILYWYPYDEPPSKSA